MLTIFKRHTNECIQSHGGKDPGRKYRRCRCAIHAEGHLGGVMYRKALDTSSWTRAEGLARDKEARGTWNDPAGKKQVTLQEAIHTFMVSVSGPSNGNAKGTVADIRSALVGVNPEWAQRTTRTYNDGLLDWCRDHGYITLQELTLPVLTEYVGPMKCSPTHRSTRIRLLRRFFRFCEAAGWITKNPAMGLSHPNGKALAVKQKEPFDLKTLPEPGPEWQAIIKYVQAHSSGPRFLALTLLMRHAGLRISDAVMFNVDKIMDDGSIWLRMKKTGEPVSIPMHSELKAALDTIEPNERGYYFSSGASTVKTAADNWRRRFEGVFKVAGIQGGHPHRFRHTFAVNLLLRGVPIDQVSEALGHSSVKITEKHYLCFVPARRKQISDSLRRAWGATAYCGRLSG